MCKHTWRNPSADDQGDTRCTKCGVLFTATNRVYFNPTTKELRIAQKSPGKPWRVLPKKVGIIWHDDQSQNQISFNGGQMSRWNYTLNPADDLALIQQYVDQIADLF